MPNVLFPTQINLELKRQSIAKAKQKSQVDREAV